MPKMLKLELVTPEKTALSDEAEMVVLPAFEGEMGVLPGHEPFIVQLNAGEVRVERAGETRCLAISGGFAEVLNNKVSVFAETAEMAEEIDAERAKQALERAKAAVRDKDADPLSLAQAESSIKRAFVRMRVASSRARPKPKG